MKNILLYSLLFLNLNQVFSQFPVTFPDSTGAWNYHFTYFDGADTYHWSNRAFVYGDSSFYGHQYNILYSGDSWIYDSTGIGLVGFFRSDSTKVYYVNYSSQFTIEITGDSTEENVLYDYSLQVGDTFRFPNSALSVPQLEIRLDSISIINILGQDHRKYNFTDIMSSWFTFPPGNIYWIEGIGSKFGFFPGLWGFEINANFVCFTENSLFYSPNPSSGYTCATVNIPEQPQLNIEIFPNPSNGIINIRFNTDYKPIQFSIINSIGELIYIGNEVNSHEQRIDLSNQPKGIYFISIQTEKERFCTKLILE